VTFVIFDTLIVINVYMLTAPHFPTLEEWKQESSLYAHCFESPHAHVSEHNSQRLSLKSTELATQKTESIALQRIKLTLYRMDLDALVKKIETWNVIYI